MELLHQSGDVIAQRYRIKSTLGQGGIGITYEAIDLQNGQTVALKALSLRRMTDWKVLELFERESKTLALLDHPGIPRYLDYFQIDTDTDRGFYLVQKLVAGASLNTWVENGWWHPKEAEVKDIAIQVLEIIVYLQSFTPPIIHRDIKPQNIILREDGRVFLVDFGAVQDIYHHTVTGGSTVVGTYGYMAPEQFRGQAVLSTDLYGLGTTILFLLIQKSPSELPQRQLKINFRPHVSISQEFADWLEKITEPIIENRFRSANEALAVLRGEQVLTNSQSQKPRKPKNSPISLTKADERLIVEIPPVWLRTKHSQLVTVLSLMWISFWVIAELRDWVIEGFQEMLWRVSFNSFYWLLSPWFLFIVFWSIGLLMLRDSLVSATSRTRLEINQQNFQIQRWFLGWCFQKVEGRTSDISRVEIGGIKPIPVCVLREKKRKHRFGSFLTQREKEWLVLEIRAFQRAFLEKLPYS
jgi:eukaryotic-like serine/threonine-protein kinase